MPTRLIRTQNFRVGDLTGLEEFYCRVLGMHCFDATPEMMSFGFESERCHLVFRKADVLPFVARPNDFYWKIGITLRDLDAAVAFLRDQGVPASGPVQFRDIGYMSKIIDPNGLIIELLQQGFEGNAQPALGGHPIGGQAILAHITLRVTDIATAQRYFGETLGMRLMSFQPVDELGFCLYFYAWSDEVLPVPNVGAVENRVWLWARPYTLIELQHLKQDGAVVHETSSDRSGFDGFSYGQADTETPLFVSTADLGHLA